MRLGIDASNIRDGGGTTHLVSILENADPGAHGIREVVVWTGPSARPMLPAREWLRAPDVPALGGSLVRRTAWQRFVLPRIAARNVDLLWCPGGNDAAGFDPFATMCRNMLPFEPRERRRYGRSWMHARLAILERTQSRAFRRAAGVIFLSEYARTRVMDRVGAIRGRSAIIPHGVDDRFRRVPRPQRPSGEVTDLDPFRLTAVSIVDVYKHQWVLVEAVGRLRAKGVPVVLDLVGGAYPPALRRLRAAIARIDPEQRVIRYVGRIPHDRLPERYHASEGFVYGSSCENLPNILLEAMAAGLPIACSNRGPMPEILGEGGVYFDPESVSETADAVSQLVADASLRRRLAAIAYERARPYTWQRCAEASLRFLAGLPAGTQVAT